MEWIVFAAAVAALFVADLTLKRGAGVRAAGCVLLALAFGGYLCATHGADAGAKFFTGYTLEMSLSLDNVFVMSLIFGALSIPPDMRGRVLTIGILTALVLRGVFIGTGAFLASRFDWLLIVCGGFLVFTGIKLLVTSEEAEVDLEKNRVLRALRRIAPITPTLQGARFFVRGAVTPLFVALVLVEVADIVFAADSVPATLAVTTDPLIVYTSNIFAILCLRALYGVLERMVGAFDQLGRAIAIVLVFIGAKVIAAHLLGIELGNGASLAVVLACLIGGVAASVVSGKLHGARS